MDSTFESILEEKYRGIIERLPVGVVIFSEEGEFLYLNSRIKELFGYSRSDIRNLEMWFETAYPDKNYREKVRNDWESAINRFFETGQKTEGLEGRVKCKDGTQKYIEFGFEVVDDIWMATCVDITNRKTIENQLVANEEKFRSLFISAGDSALILQGSRVIDCNDKTLKTLNCTREQIIGLNPWDFSPEFQPDGKPSEKKAKKMISRIYKEQAIQFEWRHKKISGEPIDMEINLSLIDRENELFFGIMRDITEKKIYQAELEKHQKHLELLISERTKELEMANRSLGSMNEILKKRKIELEETLSSLKETQSQLIQSEKMASLGIMTAGVAHEINNPLNYILGGYTAMEEYLQEKKLRDDKISTILEIIKTGINRTTDIVKSLNQFSRQHESIEEDCDIHSILDNCLLMLNNQLKHRIKINKQLSDDPVYVIGNVGKLHQVFINLLLNATQAIEIEGEITIRTAEQNGIVSVIITDTGHGISEENLHRITDPFFTTKDPGKGTGLGLAITLKLIREHKGNLEFESNPGKRTTVTVTLPSGK